MQPLSVLLSLCPSEGKGVAVESQAQSLEKLQVPTRL